MGVRCALRGWVHVLRQGHDGCDVVCSMRRDGGFAIKEGKAYAKDVIAYLRITNGGKEDEIKTVWKEQFVQGVHYAVQYAEVERRTSEQREVDIRGLVMLSFGT